MDALSPQLSGIGRYTKELAYRLPTHKNIENISFYRNGLKVNNPATLLIPSVASLTQKKIVQWRPKLPLWARDAYWKWYCRGQVFHGPNYFLPKCVDLGIATIHDLSVFKFPETHPVERVKHFEKEFTQSISRAVHLITDSEATRQEVIAFLGWPAEKITAIHLGVSSTFVPQSGPILDRKLSEYSLHQGTYTLCVSTLEPRKKIENLLQAYQSLPTHVREMTPLILVGGSGWLSDDLQTLIEKGARQGWVRYFGFVPEADLPALYAGAKLFVYPSIYEGFGLPVLEAMASGVPVVTSNRTSLPEVTNGSALLADPDDVDALANCIIRALIDDAWRMTARSTGLATAQRFSWERCVDQTVQVYAKAKKIHG